ncbi:MAG: hypothetical protein NC041_00265 [Bacteroides sp.]|nr:hypothetical protein [Prevotella sp.]MCM1408623.1 hypothetical protein [Treponema brennaborense]MCM1468889.1 hypothetical protein [Bacteroides sp.]
MKNSNWLFAILAAGIFVCTVGCDSESASDPLKFSVVYNSSYGKPPQSISVEKNSILSAEQLPELSQDGFTFCGWYSGLQRAVSGVFSVSENTVLTALWKKNNVDIHATIPVYTDMEDFTFSEETGTFSAPTGYAAYFWYMDGELLPEITGTEWALDFDAVAFGSHSIMLLATDKNGHSFSSQLEIIVCD